MEIPKKNIHLNTSRLVNFLNLRRKIKGYVQEYTKKGKNHWHRFLIWDCGAEPTETKKNDAIVKKEGSGGEGRFLGTNMQPIFKIYGCIKQGTKHCIRDHEFFFKDYLYALSYLCITYILESFFRNW